MIKKKIKLLFSSISTVGWRSPAVQSCHSAPVTQQQDVQFIKQLDQTNQRWVSGCDLRSVRTSSVRTCLFHVCPCERGDPQLSDLRTDHTGEKSTRNESRQRAESPTAKCDDSHVTIGSAHDTRTSHVKSGRMGKTSEVWRTYPQWNLLNLVYLHITFIIIFSLHVKQFITSLENIIESSKESINTAWWHTSVR